MGREAEVEVLGLPQGHPFTAGTPGSLSAGGGLPPRPTHPSLAPSSCRLHLCKLAGAITLRILDRGTALKTSEL